MFTLILEVFNSEKRCAVFVAAATVSIPMTSFASYYLTRMT